ncbi:MAG: transporter [Verrucomicrobia bacterium]|jgi:hypothetical protein|nr:transporter [Verrucomicrobiota bacterium]
MKNRLQSLLLVAALMALPSLVQAQPIVAGHYPAGAEGVKGASLPPPGVYFRDYNFFYFADNFKDLGAPFDIFAYINAPRVIWMTDVKILGANYGMDVIVPFAYLDWKLGTRDSYFGLGDIQIEPLLLSWHFKQFDLAGGYAVWAPTGDYSPNRPDFVSKGFWSHMLTLGGTWYPDEQKTWAISLLNRYEFCHEQEQTHTDPGQVYTIEWGFSKSLSKTVDVGLIGYYQQQVTEDTGPNKFSDKLDRKVGVGPEISAVCPKLGLITSLRYAYEFAAVERPEGHLVTLTLTKRF